MTKTRRMRERLAEALARHNRKRSQNRAPDRPTPATRLFLPPRPTRVRLHGLACCPCCSGVRIREAEARGGEWILATFPNVGLFVTTADLCDMPGCATDHHAEAIEMLRAIRGAITRGELKGEDVRTSAGWEDLWPAA